MIPRKFADICPPCTFVKFDEDGQRRQYDTGLTTNRGFPVPGSDESVLGRWNLPDSQVFLEFDPGEAFTDSTAGVARRLGEGELAVLLTDRSLRGVFVDGHSEYIGRLVAGWKANKSIRSLSFCWPLSEIDHIALYPTEQRVRSLDVDFVSPRARLFAREANVARDDFISRGIGWRNRLTDLAALLVQAAARAQGASTDPARRARAAEIVDGRGRSAGNGVAVWFREPADLPYQI